MQYVGDQITDVRRDTNNSDFSSTTGIDTEDVLRYVNWGQDQIFALVLQTNPNVFQAEEIISLVANQESYVLTGNVYLGERIVNVEFSPTGQVRDYYKIYESPISNRNTYPQHYPLYYTRRNGAIYLIPAPSASSGTLRVVYERALDKLDIRRGQITNRIIAGSSLTSLTLNTGSDDPTRLQSTPNYLCVSDAFGNVTAYNISYTSYDSGTGAVTLSGGAHTLASGESVSVGSYVTVGRYTTTHSKLKDPCERFLELYAASKLYERDSRGATNRNSILSEMDGVKIEILNSYQMPDKDEHEIQISNRDLMLQF